LDLQFCKVINWLILIYIVWEIALPFGGMFGFINANVGFVEVINGDSLVIFMVICTHKVVGFAKLT
jgi:hypothetical protein